MLRHIICALILIISMAAIHEARRRPDTHPNYPQMCYDRTTSTPYEVRQTWAIRNLCVLHTCKQRKGGRPYIHSRGCPERTATPPCKIQRITNELYPKCCPFEKCPPTRVDHRRPY